MIAEAMRELPTACPNNLRTLILEVESLAEQNMKP
jgi:hypothetical protein